MELSERDFFTGSSIGEILPGLTWREFCEMMTFAVGLETEYSA